jgi:DNA-binding response OmpR family regulator
MHVLVVDDDAPSVKMISFLLREEGYSVSAADNGLAALELVDKTPPDLVILDVMMTHMDGHEVCRRIRRTASVPIIFLSARGETSDRIHGLDLGADDYLAKPFDPAELLARVKAVLRRSETFSVDESNSRAVVGEFRLDPVNNKVYVGDKGVELTPIEFRLLHCLVRNSGRVLTHDQLLSTVWGYEYDGYSNQVAVYIRRLRYKIESDPGQPEHILTVRNLGYKFEAGAS